LRFQGTGYRAHDPKWSCIPLSGDGAAIDGGRFNPKGIPTFYLSLSIETALKEVAVAARPTAVGGGISVERADCAAFSMLSAPLLRERRAHVTNGAQRNRWLSRDIALMCHQRDLSEVRTKRNPGQFSVKSDVRIAH
jgi:hypothetical protein